MADAIHFVDANGLKFAYLEDGAGPLVLMLHGFPGHGAYLGRSSSSLKAAFGYYRKLSAIPSALKARITVPVVVFAGLDDPIAEPTDYRRAARMVDSEYIVEEVRGGHFMHREHPEALAERLLAHL